MLQRNLRWLILIAVIVAVAAYVDWPDNPGVHFAGFDRDFTVHEGLDLQGGMQVMLEANVPADQLVDNSAMDAARGIVENRVNGLGVSEPLVQRQGTRRIIVELPGIKDPEAAIRTFGQTGLLEFIDAATSPPRIGDLITTTLGGPTLPGGAQENQAVLPQATPSGEATPLAGTPQAATPGATTTPQPAATPSPSPSGTVTGTEPLTSTAPVSPTAPIAQSRVFTTVLTGKDLKGSDVSFDEFGKPQISFNLNSEGAKTFADFTTNNVGKYLAISLDKRVISAPVIQSPITEGNGRITGGFTLQEVNSLVIQLKYGALPIPLRVIQNRTVGPTLGQDSIQRSLIAGIIGLGLVLLFMIIYYRLPGILADVALLIYSLTVFAIFKIIPVTITVAGIAGFILSIGMAVDANILIFERMREELRLGKTLAAAIEAGFARAWTSIRDSNVSTLITCAILFWFGNNFGASIIKGFALTLGIGVLVSMFTAVFVSRTFLRVMYGLWFAGVRPIDNPRFDALFGLYRPEGGESPEPSRQP